MKFIEISNTVCANLSQIEWIANAQEGFGSTICIGGKEYPSDVPYKTLVQIIQSSDGDVTMKKLDNYLSNVTHTAL